MTPSRSASAIAVQASPPRIAGVSSSASSAARRRSANKCAVAVSGWRWSSTSPRHTGAVCGWRMHYLTEVCSCSRSRSLRDLTLVRRGLHLEQLLVAQIDGVSRGARCGGCASSVRRRGGERAGFRTGTARYVRLRRTLAQARIFRAAGGRDSRAWGRRIVRAYVCQRRQRRRQCDRVQERVVLGDHRHELGALIVGQDAHAVEVQRFRVEELTVALSTEVKVRTRGTTGGTDVADGLQALHFVAHFETGD